MMKLCPVLFCLAVSLATVQSQWTTAPPFGFTTTSFGMIGTNGVNRTLVVSRPDDAAVNNFINGLPPDQANSVRNIRNNIFISPDQQTSQIVQYLNQQGNSNAAQMYQQIQSAVTQQFQNIAGAMGSLSNEARNYVQRRQDVLNNTANGIFDLQGRLNNLGSEFDGYNSTLKTEIYNFLNSRKINETGFSTGTQPPIGMPLVTLDDNAINRINSMVLFDINNVPLSIFFNLLPSPQQQQFRDLVNGNSNKQQVYSQLMNLVNGWGPQYAQTFNSTMAQQFQTIQTYMYLLPSLAEPYKTFISKKINLMNDMTITSAQELQSMNAIAQAFASSRNSITQFVNQYSNFTVNTSPIFG